MCCLARISAYVHVDRRIQERSHPLEGEREREREGEREGGREGGRERERENASICVSSNTRLHLSLSVHACLRYSHVCDIKHENTYIHATYVLMEAKYSALTTHPRVGSEKMRVLK
jgi:hypothetical protein